jgi:hypothetical protein
MLVGLVFEVHAAERERLSYRLERGLADRRCGSWAHQANFAIFALKTASRSSKGSSDNSGRLSRQATSNRSMRAEYVSIETFSVGVLLNALTVKLARSMFA